jgi:hypothetical protein
MNTKTSHNQSYKRPAILALSLILSLVLNESAGNASNTKVASATTSSAPDAPRVDAFNLNSQPDHSAPAKTGSFGDPENAHTPIAVWFKKFDEERIKHLPSSEDKVIIARPINQQAERLVQWSAAAERIAKIYNEFSKLLRKMPVPPGYEGLKDYKDLTADWYQDTAQVFTDYIRPRKPARTIEELEDQVKEAKSHEKGLVKTKSRIVEMEASIRSKYKVPTTAQMTKLIPNLTTPTKK